jgi:hypothetical protein
VFYYDNALHFRNISENAEIRIYDLFGKVVFDGRAGEKPFAATINLPNNQIFIIHIKDNNEIVSKKIITN